MANPMQTIETQYVVEFSKTVHVLAQEKMAKLMPFVKTVDFRGEDFGYDRFGVLADQEITERFQPITLQDPSFDRRWMAPRFFAVAVGIDEKDVEKMMRNPGQELAEGCVNALMRRKDNIIYNAAGASVAVGKSAAATTPTTAANDGVVTVDATGGFGFGTLQTLKQNFVDSAVATEEEVDVALTIDGKREAQLLAEMELTSFDYARNKPVADGRMDEAYGFKLVKFASNPVTYQPLLQSNAGIRQLLALANGGMVFAKGIVSIRIEKRIDMFNTPTQIVAEMAIAAMRTEGARVQLVNVAA
ncbi:MAG: hypothetical protein KGI50_06030 [Patescibacteria group bacterium]|nr:hypothetical protein [Patescibacteria group bacterium]